MPTLAGYMCTIIKIINYNDHSTKLFSNTMMLEINTVPSSLF